MERQERRWDSCEMHTYDISTLKRGDIILSTSAEKLSGIIRRATKSQYSHAMLYVKNTVVHADEDGVFTTNPQRKLFPANTSHVYRLQGVDDLAINSACQFALNLSGSIYSIPEAILSAALRKSEVKAISDQQYCSRLVAQAYASAGIHLVRNPDYCFPGGLVDHSAAKIDHGATRPATPAELALAETIDTVKIHQENTYAWLRPFAEHARQIGFAVMTIKEAFEATVAHPELDSILAHLLERSGYLEDFTLDRLANPHRYDDRVFSKLLSKSDGSPYKILRDEYVIGVDIFNNSFSQYMQFRQIVTLRSFVLLAKLHRQRMIQARDRMKSIMTLGASDLELYAEVKDAWSKMRAVLIDTEQ